MVRAVNKIASKVRRHKGEADAPQTPQTDDSGVGDGGKSKTSWRSRVLWGLAWGAWTMAAFYTVQYGLSYLLLWTVGSERIAEIAASSVAVTIINAVVYSILLVLVIAVPWLAYKQKTSWRELGMNSWPTWLDILLSPAAFIVYMIGAALLAGIAQQVLPWFDLSQEQDVGFNNLITQTDFIVAFLALVIVAPIVEEVIFRGYLYGKLRMRLGIVMSALIVSVLFGLAHGQWNVGINVFVMSLVMCGLREVTGSIWSGVILHIIKNAIAYYLLFVNPALINF
jgi:membrane protease YdiL (CAAX protease family)